MYDQGLLLSDEGGAASGGQNGQFVSVSTAEGHVTIWSSLARDLLAGLRQGAAASPDRQQCVELRNGYVAAIDGAAGKLTEVLPMLDQNNYPINWRPMRDILAANARSSWRQLGADESEHGVGVLTLFERLMVPFELLMAQLLGFRLMQLFTLNLGPVVLGFVMIALYVSFRKQPRATAPDTAR